MNNANINILGVLNSISSDHVLAKADQIEMTMEDGTKTKIPEALLKYVRGVSSEDIEKFLDIAMAPNQTYADQLFICTRATNTNYKPGHIYYYNGSAKILTDITPATGGSEGEKVSLSVSFRDKTTETNTKIVIPYTWTSVNAGFGVVYCLVDGKIKERKRQQPGTSEWVIDSLERGNHELSIYAIDSNDKISEKWTHYISVGSLEISSKFMDNKIFKTGEDIIIPYEYYSNDAEAQLSLVYSVDDYVSETNVTSELLVTSDRLSEGTHSISLKIKSVKGEEVSYSNTLNFSILVATEGVLYVSPIGSDIITIKENEKISLNVRTTYIGAKTFAVYFKIYEQKGAEYVENPNLTIPPASWVNGINSFLVSFNKFGKYQVKAIVQYSNGETQIQNEAVYTVTVQESELYTINPVIDKNLLLHLSSSGRNNDQLDKDKWIDSSVEEYNTIHPNAHLDRAPVNIKMHNFNFKSNGWIYDDKLKQSKLVIDSGAYVEIDLKPFDHEIGTKTTADGFTENGFTFDIEFSTKDILNSNARVVSCFNGQEGFWIDTENATLSHNNSKTEVVINKKVIDTDIVVGQDEHGQDIYLQYIQYTQTGPFQTPFPSNVKNRITFVINRGSLTKDGLKEFGDYQFANMNIYVNGVLTSVERISDFTDLISTKFENNGMKIILGKDNNLKNDGYCEIFNVRAYDRALSMKEVLINYAADIEDPVKKSEMILRNELRDDAIKISDLPVMYFILKSHDAKVMSKKNKVWGKIDYRPTDSNDAFTSFMRCSWQGTSSLAYAVKNYKIKLYDTLKYTQDDKTNEIEVSGDKKKKYDLGNGIKESTFCLKADYMDSAHMRNTGTANFVSDLGTAPCPAQEYIPACRTAIYGFPILLYMVPPKNENVDINNLEGDFDKQELLGVFNFNLDKGCTDSLSLYTKDDIEETIAKKSPEMLDDFKSNYPYWDCMSMEGSANSDTTAGAFASLDDQSIYDDFELRFEDIDDLEEDGTLHKVGKVEKLESNVIISGLDVEFNDTYEIDTINNTLKGLRYDLKKVNPDLASTIDGDYELIFDWRSENKAIFTIQNGTIVYDETFKLKLGRRYSHMKKLIRWVKESNEEIFRRDFEKHFDLDGTIDYFLTVFVMLMADNLGKNCMWNTWGPISTKKYNLAEGDPTTAGKYSYTQEEIRTYDNYIWVPQFYDMDTCLGLDNSGNMRFDVHEEIEPGIFNTSNSLLWTKFRKVFAKEIKDRYVAMRKYSNQHSSYTTESFLEYFYEKQIKKISERNYNFDTVQKYLKHPDYLFMCHGRQYEFFLRWIQQRLYFLDTVFEVGTDWSDQATVRVEYKDFATKPIKFNIKTYQPSYVLVKFTAAENRWHKLKVPRNGEVEFSDYVSTATDQEVIIYNAGNIKSLGDLSPYTPKGVILDKMVKLTELIIGTDANPNPNLTSISLAENTYLTKLIAENCTSCSSQVDVSKCKNLKYVSTKGSSINYVKLSESGGALEELNLSHATTTVNVSNFKLLRKIQLEDLKNLTTLNISNCPIITGANEIVTEKGIVLEPTGEDGTIFNTILNKWSPTNQSISINLKGFGKLVNYDFMDSVAKLHENYGLEKRRITLEGQFVYTGSMIPLEYSKYEDYFPELTVRYPNVVDVSGMFKDYNNINSIIKKTVYTKDPITEHIYSEIKTFWKNPKEDKFSSVLEIIDGIGYRPIQYYDDEDQEIVANEIKKRLKPFERFTNMNEMFLDCEYIEKILPETFDHIDVSNASNSAMMQNCKNLKYFECPKFTRLDSYAFSECNNATIWIPKEIDPKQIQNYVFNTNTYVLGQHTLILFERPETEFTSDISSARDCRFNIKRNTKTNRALNREICECYNLIYHDLEDGSSWVETETQPLCLDYFNNENGKLIYKVSNYTMDGINIIPNKEPIHFSSWNLKTIDQTSSNVDYFENPLDIYEMLYGSMKYFDVSMLRTLSIPTFNAKNKDTSNTLPLYKEETNFLKLFFNSVKMNYYEYFTKLNKIYLLFDKHTTLCQNFLSDSTIQRVFCSHELEKIGKFAFANSELTEIHYSHKLNELTEYSLVSIGESAFSGSKLYHIYIPDNVTHIDQSAFSNIQTISQIKYSENMTYVPIACFADCNILPKSPIVSTITGFSSKIKRFEQEAFRGSYKLRIVQSDVKRGKYYCYWCNDPTQSKFLDYFTDLENIDDYAFKGILEIFTLHITPNIKYIGKEAFAQEKELNKPTKLVWDVHGDYSKLFIDFKAFSDRIFDWDTHIPLVEDPSQTLILEQTVFVPKSVNHVGSNAFFPPMNSNDKINLRFSLTDAPTLPEKWDRDYTFGELKRIYNYKYALKETDSANIQSLYILLNDKTAIYAKLLNNAVAVEIPSTVNLNGENFDIIELADRAFYDNDDSLNSIFFRDKFSKIKKMGNKLFKTINIANISVNGTDLYIPESIIEIGSDIPFKRTTWFKNQLKDDFIYLNKVCLGYSQNEILLSQSDKTILDSTEVIYDYAFMNENIKQIKLPSKLKTIAKGAFKNCSYLQKIDFTPCQNTLSYIGYEAFQNNSSLKEMHYTKALRHVGNSATAGCYNITKFVFDEGCTLDGFSQPISPSLNDANINVTITDLIIPASMGDFFSPFGKGNADLSLLSNIQTLILGDYSVITLPQKEGDPTKYILNLNDYYENGYYQEYQMNNLTHKEELVNKPIILELTHKDFYLPKENYYSDIDLSNIMKNTLDDEDVIRIIMGYRKNENHTVYAKSDFVNRSSASKYRILFNNRVTVIQPF